MRGMFTASAGPTLPDGKELSADEPMVIGLPLPHPLFGIAKAEPLSQVAPACNNTLSPHCEALIAACRSPPCGTTIVTALAEAQIPTKIRIENIVDEKRDDLSRRPRERDRKNILPHFGNRTISQRERLLALRPRLATGLPVYRL